MVSYLFLMKNATVKDQSRNNEIERVICGYRLKNNTNTEQLFDILDIIVKVIFLAQTFNIFFRFKNK